jgi:two-component system, cell cycle sensor histidine kinase and response regulator CckA
MNTSRRSGAIPPAVPTASDTESALRYRTFFDRSPDGLVVIDPITARPTEFNDRACVQLGYDREEFARLSLADIETTRSLDEVKALIAKVLRDGAADYDTVHRAKDGELRHVHVTAQVVDVGGSPVYYCVWRDVTARTRVAEALRTSEARLALAERSAEAGIWDWDIPAERLVGSKELYRLFGLPATAPPTFATWLGVIHPDDRQVAHDRLIQALGSGTPLNSEYRIVKPDGEVRWITARGSTTVGPDGRPVRMTGICLDTTQRRLAELALRESEERYRSLFEHMVEGFAYCRMIFDAEGRPKDFVYLAVNEAFTTLTGLHDVVGKPVSAVIPGIADSDPDLFRRYAHVARTGIPDRFEYHLAALDMWLELSVYRPAPDHFVAVFEVITERYRTREQLEVLRNSVDQAPAPAYWLDVDGRFTYVNDVGCSALGYTRSELLQLRIVDVNPRATPERWQEVWNALRQRGVLNTESEHRRKDGSLFPVELTSIYFAYAGREYCTGFAIDITERHRAEREREALQARLLQSEKMQSIGRLAGGVAHDFNNMLSVILGHSELALAAIDPGSSIHSNLDEIRIAAQRSADLTRQLLAFARRQTVVPRVLDANESIAGMLNMIRRLIGEGIALDWQPAFALPAVRVDPSQVGQILTNLAVNARDAIGDVGEVAIATGELTVGQDRAAQLGCQPGRYVVLSVRDNGSGMTPETVRHLFEPFFTTKGPGAGTGLGLATVYGIVQQNRGFIEVETAEGAGTTFTIGLPAYEGPAADAQTREAAPAGGRETVLLVEDEPAILQLGRRALADLGYQVLVAGTPGEAIAVASSHPGRIDLLVTDVVMPEMNGRELAKRLLNQFPAMARLFMSGYAADVISHHGVLEEGVNFLQKPFSAGDLAAKVREALAANGADRG